MRPCLFEAGWNDLCHAIVFIDVPRGERLGRLRDRPGLGRSGGRASGSQSGFFGDKTKPVSVSPSTTRGRSTRQAGNSNSRLSQINVTQTFRSIPLNRFGNSSRSAERLLIFDAFPHASPPRPRIRSEFLGFEKEPAMAKLTRPRLPQDDAQENFEQDGARIRGIRPRNFPPMRFRETTATRKSSAAISTSPSCNGSR